MYHLGVIWRLSNGHFEVECPVVDVPSEAGPSYTKRHLFTLSGKMFDPLRRHSTWRYCVDALRVLSEKWKDVWDYVHVLSEAEKKIVKLVVDKIQEAAKPHSHIVSYEKSDKFVIGSDAFCDGYDWLVFLANGIDTTSSFGLACSPMAYEPEVLASHPCKRKIVL
ncbi:hypothetical protein FOL47_010892 [Perkinsus chesapeaki]|uniref:Uncharacterized protein n=1 Tax=Perkinsus chesapeaki TaxID=330153 RepID=A0A7J6L0L4_PERCH|nr:hypothetical protein FOL47_010892 [Perkinsus chesapeaki]